MKWTIAPCIALLFYALLFSTGALLSLPIKTSIGISFLWTVAAILFLYYSQLRKGPLKEENNTAADALISTYGVGILIAAFAFSVFFVFIFIYSTCFFINAKEVSLSPYLIHFLISAWTTTVAYSLANALSKKRRGGSVSAQLRRDLVMQEMNQKNFIKNKIFPDITLLEDGRALDIAKIRVFDGVYSLPDFYIKEIRHIADDAAADDFIRQRAKRAVETIKKLESLPDQSFEVIKTDGSHQEDFSLGLSELLLDFASKHQSKIITAEPMQYRSEEEQSPYVVAIDSMTAFAKSNIPKGEYLSIKIQRPGKEPKQGIGYLEDSSMVVVNGGGDYLGKTIKVQFLSQKYSSSGRIFFCNAIPFTEEESSPSASSISSHQRHTSTSSPTHPNQHDFYH